MSLFIDEVIEENAKLKERIEELEEELRVAREHSNNMDWYNDNQYKLLNKYKNVIEIMKKKCRFTFYEYNGRFDDDVSIKGNDDFYDTTISFSFEEKEEFALLKEEFGNE